MFVILEEAGIGIGPEPSGGITIKIQDIPQFPGVSFGIPIGKEFADELYKGIGELLNKPKIYGPDDLREATSGSTPSA